MSSTRPPVQNVVGPVGVMVAVGAASTVNTTIEDETQPDELVTLYRIVSAPDVIPVTTPDVLTVARDVLVLLHTPPEVALARVVVRPGHTLVVPVMAATEMGAETVTVLVAVDEPHELVTV